MTKPADKERPPELRRPTREQQRQLDRQAWWAWLTVDDEDLADAILEYIEGLPAWLDPLPWFAGGLLPGLLLGLLTVLVPPVAGLPVGLRAGAALAVALFVAGGLARREPWTEQAAHFTMRVAALVLHLPYFVLLIAAGAALWPPGEPLQRENALLPLSYLVAATWLAVRAVSPRLLSHPDYNHAWPSLAGLPSLVFRLFVVVLAAVAFSAAAGSEWVTLALIVTALGLVAGARWQEQLAGRLAERLGRLPARRRDWSRRRPAPFAFEAALIECDDSAAARALAADYADRRDYSAEELDGALGRLGPGGESRRAHAAALCALELWASPVARPEAAYRGFARLDAVARRDAEALDGGFWQRFGELTAGRPLRAEGLCHLLDWRDNLGWDERVAWRRLSELDWAAAAVAAEPAVRRRLIPGVLDLLGSLADAAALHTGLCDLELAWLAASRGPLPPAWRDAALAVGDALAPAQPEPRPNNHAAYPLDLRRLAYRAEAGPAAWYAAARRFEQLPESRQNALVPAGCYWSWWQVALATSADPEERRRQAERYRRITGRVAPDEGE